MSSLPPRRASLSRCSVADCPQQLFKRGYCIDHFRTFNDAAKGASAPPASNDLPEEKLEDLRNRFKELAAKGIDDQVEFFLKSFIFDLGDNWKDINGLEKAFRKRLSDANEGKLDLNPVMAADFLQKSGMERTALQRKEEVKDIDLDNNDRISFIEYLLLHFKTMILAAYYKRLEQVCPFDLSHGGVGVTGVGPQLLEELFTMPVGLDPELEAAIEAFTARKKEREARVQALTEKASHPGVSGLAAVNELKQLEAQDHTFLNREEITLNAAKKKAATKSGDVALQKKKDAVEKAERERLEAGRNKLKDKASLWEQKK